MASVKLNTKADNAWLIKRLANSCRFFFSVSYKQRMFMGSVIARAKEINTAEDLRSTLAIQPRAWSAFMDAFFEQGGVIRSFNGKAHYGQVQTDKPEAEAFKTQPLYGDKDFDSLMRQLREQKKLGGGSQESRDQFRQDAEAEGLEDEETGDEDDNGSLGELQERLRRERDEAEQRAEHFKEELSRAQIELELADTKKVVHLELTRQDGTKQSIPMVHKTTPDLLVRVQCNLNVYLVGPAGSGKTTAAEKVSEALQLPFGFMSVGPQTTKSDIFGYMDAKGDYVATEFRRRYEEGGVFLFDEIDAAHPGVLTQVNAALAGSCCAFPDKMVKRHEEFRCVAAGNTYGTGPDRVYVGRNELDGASLDRFDFLEWGYDEALESAIAHTLTDNKEVATAWTNYVQAVRKAVTKLGIRHVVSPRATINGVKLLCAGVDRSKVEETSLFKSLKPGEVDRIKSAVAA